MIEHVTVPVPETTRKVQTAIRCDLCGQKSRWATSWTGDTYTRDDITIERETGEFYPEGGSGVTFKLDMCPTCWENKFIPWLCSQGVQPRAEEVDV